MTLTEQETTDLLARFRVMDNSNHINYRSFVNELDAVFGEDVNPSSVIQNARTSAVSYTFAQRRISDAVLNSNRSLTTRRKARCWKCSKP